MSKNRSVRERVLAEAARLVTTERNQTYGSPTQNFADTADMWTTQLSHKMKPGERIEPGDVAILMILLKACRMKANPKMDNWLDICGYGACGAEADDATGRVGAADLPQANDGWPHGREVIPT